MFSPFHLLYKCRQILHTFTSEGIGFMNRIDMKIRTHADFVDRVVEERSRREPHGHRYPDIFIIQK
jgi:hypothetical protein